MLRKLIQTTLSSLLCSLFGLWPLLAYQPTEAELRDLAKRLAPKVNFFHAVWEVDPKAEFYAGTTRDFLYWIMRQFRDARGEGQIRQIKQALLEMPSIDIRKILGPDSDVDVMSEEKAKLEKIATKDFRVRKLDRVSFERIDPKSDLGWTETAQGFIPVEKLRLSKLAGVNEPDVFGNAVAELVSGDLSLRFGKPSEFWKTHYARDGINHPMLLALRYIRIRAQDYFNRYGEAYPDSELLIEKIPKDLRKQIQTLVRASITDDKFMQFIGTLQGNKWFNAALLKAFRSHTNPTATYLLMKYFGVDQLIAAYPTQIKPMNQFLFLERRDRKEIKKAFKTARTSESDILIPVKDYFPDFRFLHGAGSEEAFRAILFQGVLPSEKGSVGSGLYGVGSKNLAFAEEWSKQHSDRSDLVVDFKISADARLIDISEGKGKRFFEKWAADHPEIASNEAENEFARTFGADILAYSYMGVRAFVVKNSAILLSGQGYYLKLLTLEELLQKARHLSSASFSDFMNDIILSNLVPAEIARILKVIPAGLLEEEIRSNRFSERLAKLQSPTDRADIIQAFLAGSKLLPDSRWLVRALKRLWLDQMYKDLNVLRPINDDAEVIEDLINRFSPRQAIKAFEALTNQEVRRRIFDSLTSRIASKEKADIHALIVSALDDRDAVVRIEAAKEIMVAMQVNVIRKSEKLKRKCEEVFLTELKNSASEAHLTAIIEYNLPDFQKVSPQVIEAFGNLANSASSSDEKRWVLKWISEIVVPLETPLLDEKGRAALSQSFADLPPILSRYLRDSDSNIRGLAAAILLTYGAFREPIDVLLKRPLMLLAIDKLSEFLEGVDGNESIRKAFAVDIRRIFNLNLEQSKKAIAKLVLERQSKLKRSKTKTPTENILVGSLMFFGSLGAIDEAVVNMFKKSRNSFVRETAIVEYLDRASWTEKNIELLFSLYKFTSKPVPGEKRLETVLKNVRWNQVPQRMNIANMAAAELIKRDLESAPRAMWSLLKYLNDHVRLSDPGLDKPETWDLETPLRGIELALRSRPSWLYESGAALEGIHVLKKNLTKATPPGIPQSFVDLLQEFLKEPACIKAIRKIVASSRIKT